MKKFFPFWRHHYLYNEKVRSFNATYVRRIGTALIITNAMAIRPPAIRTEMMTKAETISSPAPATTRANGVNMGARSHHGDMGRPIAIKIPIIKVAKAMRAKLILIF